MSIESIWSEEELPRRAVIVGISEYKHADGKKLINLQGAANDARELSDKLQKSDCGFEILHLLVDEDATCAAIRKAISDLFWEGDKSYLSLFYFSGHGIVDSYGNLFLAAHDLNPDEPFVAGINQDELQHVFFKAQNKDNCLLILDCCYSGIATKDGKSLDDYMKVVETYGNELEEKLMTGKGKIIFSSSGKNEKSREVLCRHPDGDSHHHGIFTFHLLRALDGEAQDEKNNITLADLNRYIDAQISKIGTQRPEFKGAGISGMANVRIAVASEALREWYAAKIEEIKRYLDENKPLSLLDGITLLHDDVFARVPRAPEALMLKDQCQGMLKGYIKEAKGWLRRNRTEPAIRGKMALAYQRLETLLYPLEEEDAAIFEEIAKLNRDDSGLLSLLFEVCKGDMSPKAFVGSCQEYNNPSNTAGTASAKK